MAHRANAEKNRIGWVDQFRGIAMFAIVLGHALVTDNLEYGAVNRYLYSFHVAAFFFISGYLFRAEEGFGSFALRKARTLLLPYYIFSLLSIGIFMVLGAVASEKLDVAIKTTDLLPNLLGMLYANGASGYMKWNRPLWFIPCLFAMTLVFFGIRRLLSRLQQRLGQTGACLSALGASFGLSYLNYYVLRWETLPFGLETVVYMLPFFLSGFWVRLAVDFTRFPRRRMLPLGLLGIAVGAFLSCFFEKRVGYSISRYENLTVFYLGAFASIAGYVFVCQFLSGKILACLGQNTLPVLTMHKFPLVFFQLLLGRWMESSDALGLSIGVVGSVLACVLCLVAGKLLGKLFPPALGQRWKQ